jgi:hypothetical protein
MAATHLRCDLKLQECLTLGNLKSLVIKLTPVAMGPIPP